jgi:hypothetical protein
MTNPWTAPDAATGQKKLYLEPSVRDDVVSAVNDYDKVLSQLIVDRVDNTKGYFGTDGNPLAKLLETAFNARGTELVTYLNAQMSQTQDFVKTARDAATAQANRENG